MKGLEFLDLVIGLVFIYLIYSIACSTIWEMFANLFSIRGKTLQKWFQSNFSNPVPVDEIYTGNLIKDAYGGNKPKLTLLRGWIKKIFKDFFQTGGPRPGDQNTVTFGDKILRHSLLKGLSKADNQIPSYVPSNLFSDVLIDLVVNDKNTNKKDKFQIIDITRLKDKLKNTDYLPKELSRIFYQYLIDSGDIHEAKEKIGKWFEDAQERLIGSYKRHLQKYILGIAIVLVGLTNADTINLVNFLYNNDEARETLATKAELFLQDSIIINKVEEIRSFNPDSLKALTQGKSLEKIDENVKTLETLRAELSKEVVPLGWEIERGRLLKKSGSIIGANSREKDYSLGFWLWVKKISGLLLTAMAVSMGAPFWFDILNKFVNLRSSGKKPKTILEGKG